MKMAFYSLLTSIVMLVGNAAGQTVTILYKYDHAGQLVSENFGPTNSFYVYDDAGNRISRTIYPSDATENSFPDIPTLLSPADGENNVNQPVQLAWNGSDPNPDDKLSFSIYLGENAQLQEIRSGIYETTYSIPRLKANTKYYWKIEAKDNFNAVAASDLHSFETGNQPPELPDGELPEDASVVTFENVTLQWVCRNTEVEDNLSFDLYFGTSQNPPLIISDLTDRTYALGKLNAATQYYWRIAAKDANGAQTSGPVWSFETLAHAPTPLNYNSISGDVVLTKADGPYIVHGTIRIAESTTVTIEPGTVLKFEKGAKLQIDGTLKAQGTSANRIVFTSDKDDSYFGDTDGDGYSTLPSAGDWVGIVFSAKSQDNLLEFADILYAGRSANGCALSISNASTEIANCTINHSQGDGIDIKSGTPSITASSIENCGRFGIKSDARASASRVVDNIFGAASLYLNADDVSAFMGANIVRTQTADSRVEVAGGTIGHDAVWPAGPAYRINGNLTVQGTDGEDGLTTLRLAPGAQLRFAGSYYLNVGRSSGAPGALVAEGTADNKIVFTSDRDPRNPGDWAGICFYDTADDSTSRLSHCVIEYAGRGSSGRAIYIYKASPTISDCTIQFSQGDGIYVGNGAPQLIGNAIGDYDRYGIYLAAGASDTRLQENEFSSASVYLNADNIGGFFSSNTINEITADSRVEVAGGTIGHDAVWPAGPAYRINGNLTVQGTDGEDGVTTLRLAPGAQLRFVGSYYLNVGRSSGAPGALVAEGTADNKIVFTSDRDPRNPGDWAGICFYDTADGSTSRLSHCVIEYAGRGSSGRAIYIYKASPVITDSIIRYSQANGIYVQNGSPIVSGCSISDTAVGIYVSIGAPIIHGNRIEDNDSFGVYNRVSTVLSAEDNWWGHLSGPFHETGNPGGLGDAVSDYVDFDPWVLDPDDMDMDTIPDDWELSHFGELDAIDQATDYDQDGLTDSQEYGHGTDPTNPDTDHDNMSDGDEVSAGSDPLAP
jgi:YD repeat-containing protein